VIEAARLFGQSNLGVFDDPRTRTHIDDARHFLLASDAQFDVIVSDLFVPWESRTGYLYTVDHYRLSKVRLKPGGIYCQWLPLWQLGSDEFEMIANGFADVFPYATLWLGKGAKFKTVAALIGSDQPLQLDAQSLDARIRTTFSNSTTADCLAQLYIGRWPASPEGLRNTDEHPRLEFAMPLTYADRRTLQQQRLRAYFDDVLAKLPQEGVSQVTSAAERHRWQALQLRK
jgi:spermidine synthase